jgi:hypothetical protein
LYEYGQDGDRPHAKDDVNLACNIFVRANRQTLESEDFLQDVTIITDVDMDEKIEYELDFLADVRRFHHEIIDNQDKRVV